MELEQYEVAGVDEWDEMVVVDSSDEMVVVDRLYVVVALQLVKGVVNDLDVVVASHLVMGVESSVLVVLLLELAALRDGAVVELELETSVVVAAYGDYGEGSRGSCNRSCV